VLANVTLPLQIQGRSKAESKTIALEHLARVGRHAAARVDCPRLVV